MSSLLFRLRRICNHSLLMQSRYTAEQKDVSGVSYIYIYIQRPSVWICFVLLCLVLLPCVEAIFINVVTRVLDNIIISFLRV